MKEELMIYKNWRISLLGIIIMISLFFALAISDDILRLIISKVVAILGFSATYLLYDNWNKKGLIDELSVFDEEED